MTTVTTTTPAKSLTAAQKMALCAAAAATCVTLTQSSEGIVHRPTLDPAHILSVCYGDRYDIDPAKIYSTDECVARLRHKLATVYAPQILDCLPQLADQRRSKIFGALLDAAYNAGAHAVCVSRMAVSLRAGDLKGMCNGFYGWRATALDRKTHQRIKLKGLETRRGKEAALCLQGLA